jgi:hypothetical protein
LDSAEVVAGLASWARVAMKSISGYDQERVNEVVQAAAWAIIERERAEELARVAVEDPGSETSRTRLPTTSARPLALCGTF